MEEKLIWKGSPSQWMNVFTFIISAILIIPIPFAIWKYFQVKFWSFEITDTRIVEHSGVFSKTVDEIQLYRVRDIRLEQPFIFMLLGLSNIILVTRDRTSIVMVIPAIP